VSERYNGWTNYETWDVHLWLSNEEDTQRAWERNAFTCWEQAEEHASYQSRSDKARQLLGDQLREATEDHPLIDSPGVYCDILSCAIGRVNWDEIADALMQAVTDYVPVEKTQETEA